MTRVTVLERRWLGIFVLLYAVMPFIGPQWHPALPIVWQGDEPHYFVMLSSLLQDGDLDLKNNYIAARKGGLDAGRRNAGHGLNHQTSWWREGQRIEWSDHHWFPSSPIGVEPSPDEAPDLAGVIERPVHPPGLPWLLALVLWPFRGTSWVEHLSVLLITISGIAAMLLFHALVRSWTSGAQSALPVTAAAFFGTPVWHYSRKLFVEEPLTLCAIGAACFVLRWRNGWVAGAFLAAGTLMKPPFLLLALPLVIFLVSREEWALLGRLAFMCLLAVAVTLLTDELLFGSPWRSAQPFVVGNPLAGAWGLLAGQERGILWFAPVIAAACAGWPSFWRRQPAGAGVLVGSIALYCGLMATWKVWTGGWCYGPRLIVPVLPFAMVGLLGLQDAARWLRGAAVALGVASVATNAIAAGGWAYVSNENPYVTLLREARRHR
jgi:hypothetical protein